MQTEVEAKFLNIDYDKMRQQLIASGAELTHPMCLMRRKNFDHPDGRLEKIGGWIRVRDEGSKLTLAYKQLNNRTLRGTKEISIIVDDFEETCKFLKAIGLKQKSYQETKRESWVLDDVDIELDEWPWVQPFVELEGRSEGQLKKIAQKLGLDWSHTIHGSVENVYQAEYDVTEKEVDSIPKIIFGDVPEWLEKRRKK